MICSVTAIGLNVHQEAMASSPVVTQFTHGQKVIVLDNSNFRWKFVKADGGKQNGQTGYVDARFIAIASPPRLVPTVLPAVLPPARPPLPNAVIDGEDIGLTELPAQPTQEPEDEPRTLAGVLVAGAAILGAAIVIGVLIALMAL